MHFGPKEAGTFVEEVIKKISGLEELVEIGVAPPFLSIPIVRDVLERNSSSILLCAQNCHWEEKGAFTGEVSPSMLKEIGVKYVIIGHSERRGYFSEDDEIINKKLKAVRRNGLNGILCVGEKLEEREKGRTMDVIRKQVEKGLDGLEVEGIIIAYEPVWAIGTGKTATPETAEEVHYFIKELIKKISGKDVRVIYGGSVKPENIKPLLSMEHIDGALVGGASINTQTFYGIIKNWFI